MRSDRVKSIAAVSGVFALLAAMATIGWSLRRADSTPASLAAAGQPSVTTTSTPSETAQPTSAPPTVASTPTPTPTKKVVPKPTTTRMPPAARVPPPPPKPVSESPSCTQHPGPDAPAGDVSAALVTAGSKQYWIGVERPPGLVGDLPVITVPANLMKAFAWAESSWRSTIVSCDGGVGLMQIMSYNQDFVNQRFGEAYDRTIMSDNVAIGATYIEWLTMYFGLYYFGSFELTATAAVGAGGATMRLRDVVIAAYNVGHRAVEDEHGTPLDSGDDTLSIPNQYYVDRVTAYMTNCPCDGLGPW